MDATGSSSSSRAEAHISGPHALGAAPEEATAKPQGVSNAAQAALEGMKTTCSSSMGLRKKNVSANLPKTGLMKKIGQLFSRIFGTITSAFNRSKGQNAVTRLSEKFGTEKATALHTALQSVPKENRKNYTAGVMALSNELSTEDITAAISTYNQEGVAGRTFKADMQTIGQLELIDQQRCFYYLKVPFENKGEVGGITGALNWLIQRLKEAPSDLEKKSAVKSLTIWTTPKEFKLTTEIP